MKAVSCVGVQPNDDIDSILATIWASSCFTWSGHWQCFCKVCRLQACLHVCGQLSNILCHSRTSVECKRLVFLGLTRLLKGTQPLIGALCGCQACTQRSKYSGMQLYPTASVQLLLDLSQLTPCVTRSVPELAVTIYTAWSCQICQSRSTYKVNRRDRISQAPKSSHKACHVWVYLLHNGQWNAV